jgi:hypothetical protein
MFMHWLRTYAFGSHLVDWLALAAVVVLTFALRLAARRFIVGMLHANVTKAGVRGSIGADMEDRTDPIELTIFLAELRCAQVVTAGWSGGAFGFR